MPRFLDAAADLLLGAACPACHAPGWGVCGQCRTALDTPVRMIDRGLGVPLAAACPYRPILNHVVPRYKDDGALHLEELLVGLLARAAGSLAPPPATLLVPVPSRPAAVRQRGYDHAWRLGRGAARRAGLVSVAALARTANGEDQEHLGRAARATNLALTMRARFVPAPVLLVDDVTTTGASLREAVRALRHAGATVVGAAVVADADYA